jgi:hypothetical protein
MNETTIDQQLLQMVTNAAPTSIPEVISIMEEIDNLLPSNDGLKWFNLLYLMVTKQVDSKPPSGGWKDPAWLTKLDVVFAGFYFAAIKSCLSDTGETATCWDALFESRFSSGIDRIQFAFAGMNAHINHDLALALMQTNSYLNVSPGLNSPEREDFELVNGLLEQVLPFALQILSTGLLGELAQDTGKIGRILAIWNVRLARDLAWDFSTHLSKLDPLERKVALLAQDRLTGVIGRSLLLAA